MELKYSNRLLDGEAFVLLNEEITQHNSMMIAEEIYFLKAQGFHMTLKINSVGGSVLAGWNIIDALITTESDTHIIGLAASMAGVISQFGVKRLANDNAIGMIHPPSGGSGEVIEMVRSSLKKALTSRSNLSKIEIDSYLDATGTENFFDASELLEKGLIDEIVETGIKSEAIDNKNTEELFQIFNKQIKEKAMDIDLKNELKTANDEKAVLASQVEGLTGEKKTLTNSLSESATKVTELETEVGELKNQLGEANKSKATVLITNAIEKGILSEDKKDEMIDKATENYELVNSLLGEIKAPEMVIENFMNNDKTKNFADMNEEEKADFARKNPEAYNKLILKQ